MTVEGTDSFTFFSCAPRGSLVGPGVFSSADLVQFARFGYPCPRAGGPIMPKSAEPFRKVVVRYQLSSGKRCPKDHPRAVKVTTETDTFYGSIHGRVQSLGTTDIGEAWEELHRRQRGEVAGGGQNLPLARLVQQYRQHVEDSGSSPEWALTVAQRLTKLFGLAQWTLARHMEADGLLGALATITRQGIGNQTRNHYLTHARAFSSWLVPRLGRDPLRKVGRPLPVQADPRHPRRCPSREEVGTLFVFLDGPRARKRWRMSPRQRSLGYQICMCTGFRAGELRSLTRESFDLEMGTVTVLAGYSKNHRRDTQPLPVWLAADLQEWFAGGGGCWRDFPAHHPGQVLRADLEEADIPYWTEEGFFDLHSLRHYYVSALANQPGISIKTLQTLARHSTPSLTIAVYAHARKHDLFAAVDDLPRPVVAGKKSLLVATSPDPAGPRTGTQ